MHYSDTKVILKKDSRRLYGRLMLKWSMTVPVIRQLLKSLLLLLIVSVCLWFGYIRLHKMKSRDEVEHQKTTTPYDWIDRTNFSAENQTITTPSIKIGTHHTIIGTKSSERMKNAAQEHKSTTIRPENLMPVESIYHTKPNQNDAMPMIKHKAENNVFTTNRNHIEFGGENYPKYYEDNLHPHWVFKISRTYDPKLLRDWTEPNRTTQNSKPWMQGEYGSGFLPKSKQENVTVNKIIEQHNYNLYASDHFSLRRSLLDYRNEQCRKLTYPNRLPTVSIVIIFHNEPWSIILRTIWSIIDRSPSELLHEIILVDDVSTMDILKRPLDDYIETFPANVRIIRNKRREGLIRARLIGAEEATGSILIFLDAHMECTKGWLEPLVARIANDRSVIAVPIIDILSLNNMSYIASPTIINMFRWNLIFNRVDVPERELKRINYDPTAPIRTPTHIGCAFAVDRNFFYEIGTFDDKMDIWGSENIELAIRVWMCGGSLEIVPCSRVGHIFRHSTYSFEGDRATITMRNNVRLAEVWMDEYKELFYAANRLSQNVLPGSLNARKRLRKQLKCKSFRWYLDNIFPESNMRKEYITMGEVRNDATKLCLDQSQKKPQVNDELVLLDCHGKAHQFFAFAKSGQITISEGYCIGVNQTTNQTMDDGVYVVRCSDTDPTQLWTYNKEQKWIVHNEDNLCMQSRGTNIQAKEVILAPCDPWNNHFKWTLKSTMRTDLTKNRRSSTESSRSP